MKGRMYAFVRERGERVLVCVCVREGNTHTHSSEIPLGLPGTTGVPGYAAGCLS